MAKRKSIKKQVTHFDNGITTFQLNNNVLNRTETVQINTTDFEQFKHLSMWLDFNGNTCYVRCKTTNGFTRLHNLVMGKAPESKPLIDHKDGNGLNNTRNNLRFVTRSQNARNRKNKFNRYVVANPVVQLELFSQLQSL